MMRSLFFHCYVVVASSSFVVACSPPSSIMLRHRWGREWYRWGYWYKERRTETDEKHDGLLSLPWCRRISTIFSRYNNFFSTKSILLRSCYTTITSTVVPQQHRSFSSSLETTQKKDTSAISLTSTDGVMGIPIDFDIASSLSRGKKVKSLPSN